MFQLEVMLPLLILAFLGTPAILAQSYHGNEIGKHSCISAPEGKNVTAIRIFIRSNVIVRIQLKFGEEWGKEYGAPGGRELEFKLNDDEKVMGIYTTSSTFVNQIIFITDQPREVMAGSFRGRDSHSSYPEKPTYMFRGVCVYYGPGGIRGIKFLWGTENSSCSW
ncbi:prostatic spermine-binding protein-like [Arvicanthis niloticus]|uniref:prostatic spermine-binding protein-like n=1 Tax=Arvicanthis niloticus TaxID=61156 RepID=UPI001485D523|nr:prostatic spermine-binding protein-like [Arvicanthis niloticus]